MDVIKLHCQVCCVSFGTISDLKSHLRSHKQKLKEIFPKDACSFKGHLPNIPIVKVTRNAIVKKPNHIPGISQLTMCFSPGSRTSFYLCHICKEKCSEYGISHHLKSGEHHRNVFSNTDPNLMDFSWIPSDDITVLQQHQTSKDTELRLLQIPLILLLKLEDKYYSEVMGIFKGNEKLLKLLEVPFTKIRIEMYQKDSNRKHPLLGMQHLVECICEEMDEQRHYLCTLCHLTLTAENITTHVLSFDHIFCYFSKWHPTTLLSKASYKYNNQFRSMILNLSKQAEEISGEKNVMKKVSLKPAEFTSMNFKGYKQALNQLICIKKCGFVSKIEPVGKLEYFEEPSAISVSTLPVTNSGPSPAQSAPLSGKLASSPEQSVSLPEQSATSSEKSAFSPTQSTPLSGKLASSPEESVSVPAQSASLLTQSATSSEKSVSSPAQSASLSGKLTSSLGKSREFASSSAQSTSPPAQSNPLPGKMAPPVAKFASLNVQPSLSSEEYAELQTQSSSSLSQSIPSSVKSLLSPVESALLSEKSAVLQAQSASSVAKSTPCSGKPSSSPVQSVAASVVSSSSPVQSVAASVVSSSSPVQSVAASVVSSSSPVQSVAASVVSSSSPVQSVAASVVSSSSPVQSVAASVVSSSSPVQSVAASVVSSSLPKQAAPSSGNPASSSTQSASLSGTSAPAKAPSSGNPVSSPTQSAPLSEKSAVLEPQSASSMAKSGPSSGKAAPLLADCTSSSAKASSGECVPFSSQKSRSSACKKSIPPKSWPLLCQNCDEFAPNMFCYLKHINGKQHKWISMKQFKEGHCFMSENVGKRGIRYLHIYGYIQRCLRGEEPFIGMPFVVSCISSEPSIPAIHTCFACKECFEENSIEGHFASRKHLLMTLVQYQNPDLLPFAWAMNDVSSSKELRKRVMESEKPPSNIPIKVLHLPTWKLSQIGGLAFENVLMNLQEYMDLFSNRVPLIENFLQFEHSHQCPVLGLEFLVLYDSYYTSQGKNLRERSLLCLLCDRQLSEEEHYFHIYSLEHVRSFLEGFHPGSLSSSNMNAETLLDLAQQASKRHPKRSMQVVKPFQCILASHPFYQKKRILSFGLAYKNTNMVVPPISPKGKLFPSKTLQQQKRKTVDINSQKTDIDTQKLCTNDERLKDDDPKTEVPSEQKLEVKPEKNIEDSGLLKGEEKPVIQKGSEANPTSCSLNSDGCLGEENQIEVNESQEDVNKGISACVSEVNEKKKRNGGPEKCQDGDEWIEMDHKRQRLIIEEDSLREEPPKIQNSEQNKEEAAGAKYSPNMALGKGLSTLFDCRCSKHETIYICECCSLKIPQGNIISHITELGHPKVHLKVLDLGEDDYNKISIQNFETAVLTIKAFLDSREAHLEIPLVADPLSSPAVVQVDTTVTLDDQHDGDDTLKDSKFKYAHPSKDGHSLPITATVSESTRAFSTPKDVDSTSKETKTEICPDAPMEKCEAFISSEIEDKTISSKVAAAPSKPTAVTSTSGDVVSTTNLVTASVPLKGKAAAKSERNPTTNIVGLKTQIPEKNPKTFQTSSKTSVTNMSKEDFCSPYKVQKPTEVLKDNYPPSQPNAGKNQGCDISRVATNTSVGSELEQPLTEPFHMALKNLGSIKVLPKIGRNQMIKVNCLTKEKWQIYCKLCSVRLLNSQHLCSIEHHCKYLQILFPRLSAEPKEIEEKINALAKEEKQREYAAESINVTWEQYERLGSLKASAAIAKIKQLLRSRDTKNCAKDWANPEKVSQDFLQGSPCEVSSSDCGADIEHPDGSAQPEELVSPSQLSKNPETFQEACVSSQQQPQQRPEQRSKDALKISESRRTSLKEAVKTNQQTSFTVTHDVLQNQQRPIQEDSCAAEHDPALEFLGKDPYSEGLQNQQRSIQEDVCPAEHEPALEFLAKGPYSEVQQNQQRSIQEYACSAEHDPALEFFGKGQKIEDSSNLASFLKVRNLDSKPIVGKDKVWECRGVSRRTFYLCESCEMMMRVSDICQHFISLDHQFNYVRENHPELLGFWSEEDLSMDEKLEVFDCVVHELSNRDRGLEVDVKVVMLWPELYEYLQKARFCEAVKALQSIIKQKQQAPWVLVRPQQQKSQHTEAAQGLEETLTSQGPSAPIPKTDEKSGNDESRFGSEGVTSDRHVSPKESCSSLSEHPGVSALVYQQSKDLISTSQGKENNMVLVYTETKEAQCFPGKCSPSRKRPPDASLETLVKSCTTSPNAEPLPEKCKPNPGQSHPSDSPPEFVNPSSSTAIEKNSLPASDQQAHSNYFASLETLVRYCTINPNDDPLPEKCKPDPGKSPPPSESSREFMNPSSSTAIEENSLPTSDQQAHSNYFAVLSNIIIKLRNQKSQLSMSASNNTKAVDSGSTNSRESMKTIELCPGTSNVNVKREETKQENCLVQSTATKPTTHVSISVEATTPKEVLSDFESKSQLLTLCGKSVSLENKSLLPNINSKAASDPPTSATITNPSDLQQLEHVQENMTTPEFGCVEREPEKETNPDETSVCAIDTIVTKRAENAYHSFSRPQSRAPAEKEVVPQITVTTPTTETSVTLTTYAQYSQAVYVTSGDSVCVPPVNPLVNSLVNPPVNPLVTPPFNSAVHPPVMPSSILPPTPPVNPPFHFAVHPPVMPPFNFPPNPQMYPTAYPSFNPAANSGCFTQSAVREYSPAVNNMQSIEQNPALSMQQQQAYQLYQQYQQLWQQEQYRLYQQYQFQ